MPSRSRSCSLLVAASALAAVLCAPLAAQTPAAQAATTHITTPKEEFGANFGDDYFLANYKQIAAYWQKLARQSKRIVVQDMGKTAEGRTQYMAIVTSPANHLRLARYKQISRQLALAEGLTDAQARALAKEGKTVVWIDGGLHASESLGAQQLGEMVYQMVSRTDEETMRFLNDCVILLVHANPDGNDLIADWYMRNPDPKARVLSGFPKLYQKYIGHDNNRDFFGSTQAETENMNRALYREWFPQLLYNHHQSGPAGTVVYSPPLRDPYNYNLDPALILGLQSIGAALHTRLAIENKPGATMRSGGPYDGWWNGGLRNTATFHNMIAILTEMIGSPTPTRVSLDLARQIPGSDLAFPIAPQEWHLRQSIDYSISLNRALLDYASRMRENVLYNFYVMGRRSIERGNRDTWTANPRRDQAIAAQAGRGGRGSAAADSATWAAIHAPALRDPRGYIIPSDQPDFPTATQFVNALLETGIAVQRATRAFTVAGKGYPAGSYVVMSAQSFRPHIIDMFEPQVHPDVFPIPGGAPTPPYDNAGWTLAFQMGVQFDRILDGFTGPFEKIPDWNIKPPAGRVVGGEPLAAGGGFLTSHRVNNAFIVVNRLLKASENVTVLATPMVANGRTYGPGSFFVQTKPSTRAALVRIATDLGVNFDATTETPRDATPLRTMRVGLWDQFGGSITAGWTRWILEQFEFPFERVFAPALDAGNLNQRFDVLVFVDGAIAAREGSAVAAPGGGGGAGAAGGGGGGRGGTMDLPAEYRDQMGSVTGARTLPQIKAFIEGGGTVVAIGSSAVAMAAFLKLPVTNHLVENGADLTRTKFFVPGSVLRMRVDTTAASAYGMTAETDVFFDNSPVFRLLPNAEAAGVRRVAWFDSKTPLRSGWAWGQNYLENGVAAIEARVGQGRVLLYGPEILQRAQPHGTFKFLFNGIYFPPGR